MDKRELRDRLLPYLVHDCGFIYVPGSGILVHCDCDAGRNTERIIDLIGDPGPVSTWFWADIAAQLRNKATGA